jgi:DNA-binding transcriptional LysR family regulator
VSVIGRPPAGVTLRTLAAERLDLVSSPGNPLAGRARVTVADLADATFIDFPVGWGTRALVDQTFAAAGHTRTVPFEVAGYADAAGLVRQGLGVGFLPASVAERMTDLHRLRLEGPELIWRVYLATASARRLSAAAMALLTDPELASTPV